MSLTREDFNKAQILYAELKKLEEYMQVLKKHMLGGWYKGEMWV